MVLVGKTSILSYIHAACWLTSFLPGMAANATGNVS